MQQLNLAYKAIIDDILNSSWAIIIFSMIIVAFEYLAAYYYTMITGNTLIASSTFFMFYSGYSLIFFFVIPFCVAKYILSLNASALYLQAPLNKTRAIIWAVTIYVLLIPVFAYLATLSQFIIAYSAVSAHAIDATTFWTFQLLCLPIYYFAEEFFFRGFLFSSLLRNMGWHSYWMTELIFAIAHTGKPPVEILISFPVGIILNFVTYRTKSIYPAVFIHGGLGFSLNVMLRAHGV